MSFKEQLKKYQDIINNELVKYCKNKDCYEKQLNDSMEYSLLAGGKRLRPILVIATYQLFKDDYSRCMPYAIAIEMVHNFSLIHDDLPGIDNDDFRHGKPTNHKQFNEATAILAGDALLNNAYMILSQDLKKTINPQKNADIDEFVKNASLKDDFAKDANLKDKLAKDESLKDEFAQDVSLKDKFAQDESLKDEFAKDINLKLEVFQEFTTAVDRMIAGEYVDTEAEGKEITKEELEYIHKNKTGALLKLCVRMGAILAGAEKSDIENLTNYADKIGLAFQIKDDILSEEGDEKQLGKPVGNDKERKKCTYVSQYGLAGAKNKLEQLTNEAINDLKIYGLKAEFLNELALYIANRNK